MFQKIISTLISGRQDVGRGHREADDAGSARREERALRGQGQDRGRSLQRRFGQGHALHVQGRRRRQRRIGRGRLGDRERSVKVRPHL